MNETDYTRGNNDAWARMLRECLRHLEPGPQRDHAALVAERADAIAMLRMVCEDHGDNDWPDDLHLGDIIDKHLLRYF